MQTLTERSAARVAGLAYLTVAALAMFANFAVLENLIEPGDATATAANITGSEGLFRAGLASFLVVIALDVILAWALYVYFRPVNRHLSSLIAAFRLVFATIFGVALINLFSVLHLMSGASYLTAFEGGQLDAQMMLAVDGFNYGWLISLAFFGIHLLLLGYLILKSRAAPKLLGILLVLAGAAYVTDTLANALLTNYADYETVFLLMVAVPSVIGELAFALWLLLRGGKGQKAEASIATTPHPVSDALSGVSADA